MLTEIFRAFGEYKKLTAVLIVAVVLMLFMWVMALRAAKKRNAERDKILARLQEENALRSEFAAVTPEQAQSADCFRMLHGIALHIQKELEKSTDMVAAFRALPQEKQYIYALSFVFCEDAETLCTFFRLNEKPLTEAALSAAREMFDAAHLAQFEKAYRMFDPDDETTSTIASEMQTLDESFAAGQEPLKDGIRQYITAHTQALQYTLEG